MRKLLNILYITTPGSYLHRDGETVAIERENQTVLKIPIHNLEGIVCLARAMASPQLMSLCSDRKVAISFCSESGRFLGRVQGPVAGNVLLRRQQYRWADIPERCASITASIVGAKIANARLLLLRATRERANGVETLSRSVDIHSRILESIARGSDLSVDELRGMEGEAARSYFAAFNSLLATGVESELNFRGRTRRPPKDPINALLSYVYMLLIHEVTAALDAVGLDPYVGFLHTDRPGRPSLALDMVEELRPLIADRFVLALINRKQVSASDFITEENGAVVISDRTRKQVIEAWQNRKQQAVRHPFLDEQIEWGLVPHVQALLLARHIRGDLDAYPALVLIK